MRFPKLAAVLAAVGAGVLGQAAFGQEVALKVHHLLPPPSTAHAKFLVPWTQKIEKQCPGKLKFTIYPSMQLGGTPPQLYDQAKDGVVDIIWTVLGYTPGRFPGSEAFELPFMTRTAKGSSRAFWEYANANGLMAGEFRDTKVLALHVHDEGLIFTTSKQVKVLSDFKGMKLRGPTRLTTKMLANFGATPVGMPVTQVGESLSKGVIDGAIIPWEIAPAIKAHELAKYQSETDPKSRNLYTATFIVAMNKAKYESLPPDAKKCLDANSGAELSEHIGKIWDDSAAGARKLAQARGNIFYTVPAAELVNWEKASAGIADEWIRDVGARGLNGQNLLKSAREMIDKYDSK